MSKTKTYEEYKLKSGKKMWHVHAYIGTDPRTGKAKYFDRRKFSTKADAKAALINAKADFQRGLNIANGNSSPILADVYSEWKPLHDDCVRPSTAELVAKTWRIIVEPKFGQWHIDTISPRECQLWFMQLAKKYAHLENIKSCLNMIFRYAMRMEYVNRNPMEAIELPRKRIDTHRIKKNYFELDELKTFVNATYKIVVTDESSEKTEMRVAAALLTIAATGMRVGEAGALRWADIDLANGIIHISQTLTRYDGKTVVGPAKTSSSVRSVRFGGLALDALKKWQHVQFRILGIDVAPNVFVFASPFQPFVPASKTVINYWLASITRHAGIHRITPHGLRHTKATLLNQAGVSPIDISAALGHTNSQFTMRTYVHPTRGGTEAAEAKFQQMVNL